MVIKIGFGRSGEFRVLYCLHGAALGPLLLSMYINDIPADIQSDIKISLLTIVFVFLVLSFLSRLKYELGYLISLYRFMDLLF